MATPQKHTSAGHVQFTDPRPPKPKSPPSTETPTTKEDGATMQQNEVENRPIPTMGWPAVWYGVCKSFNKNAAIPQLSKKEFAILEQKKAEEQRNRNRADGIRILKTLSDDVKSLTVTFIGVKGAAATTTTTAHAASVAGDLTRSALVASDFNPASGTLASRLGKDYDQTTTLRELRGDIEGFKNFKDFIAKIRPTRYSVRPISANDIVSGSQHLTREDAEIMLNTIANNTEYHYIDTANDITDPVTLAAVEVSDVFVFTAYVGIHDSLRQLAIGMETLRQHGYEEKVNNSVVVISGVPEGEDPEIYRKYLNRVNIRDEVVQRYNFDGPFLHIPYDEVIRRDTEVNLEALNHDTYQAYLELNIFIFEQSPKYRERGFDRKTETMQGASSSLPQA